MQRYPEGTGPNMPDPSQTEWHPADFGIFYKESTIPVVRGNIIDLNYLDSTQETLQSESFFELGYDLNDPADARKYLTEVHGHDLPRSKGSFDERTFYHLARAMQKEKRAAMYEKENPENEDEPFVYQNVAEHSFNLSVAALTVAASERPDLDLKIIGIMATFHDLVPEAYGHDTPVNDVEAMKTKSPREKASETIFFAEIGNDSEIAQIMKEYEAGISPEARFVKGMDKVEAAQHSLDSRATLHKVRWETFEDVAQGYLVRASIDHTSYDLMQGIMLELGRKWTNWGCIPIDGSPEDIVNRCKEDIMAKSAEVLAFEQALPNGAIIPEHETPLAEVRQIRTNEEPELTPLLQRVISLEELQEREVAVLSLRRRDNNPIPPSPTQPGSEGAIAV